MGDSRGFITVGRKEGGYRPVNERIYDFGEVEQTLNFQDRKMQASRCMDCGVPFCHWACPLGNRMPEWQDALYRNRLEEAYEILHVTNRFPEITGRICPAPCEKSCVLAIHEEAVTIRENECATVEMAFSRGIIKPQPPKRRTGKTVVVIGSGPAGLSAADRLNQAGHLVTVFEKNDAIGGLMRYGIPDFKLNKAVIDRRISLFEKEGIVFKTNILAGKNVSSDDLLENFDAVVLATGSEQPRDLQVNGRELEGIYFAMDYLKQSNLKVAGKEIPVDEMIDAKEKNVLVIGGGDTGSDCVGTAIRQRAASVMQIEILPKPPVKRNINNPWPYWPNVLRTSSSHQEGCTRRWSLLTKNFFGQNGKVKQAEVIKVVWTKNKQGQWIMTEKGDPELLKVDLVLLAMGFTQPIHHGLLDSLGLEYDVRGNVKVNEKNQTSNDKVFAAGDVARGATLVVKAIAEGVSTAVFVDEYLTGS